MTALNRVKPDHVVSLDDMPALRQPLAHELAQNWAEKAHQFEREMDVIRGSIRRMDRLAAAADAPKGAHAAE